MIVAIPNNGPGERVRVHGLVNRGGCFGQTWLCVVTIATALHAAIVIEAGNAQDAIDELADSPTWAHLIDCDECWDCGSTEPYCDCDDQSYAGNDGHRVNLDYVTVLERCKVLYFEQEDNSWH